MMIARSDLEPTRLAALRFTVLGTPVPQGSKVRTRWGGMREANPATQPWRDTIAYKAAEAMRGQDPISGPVTMLVHFWMPRPKAHFGTGKNAAVLKESAPEFCPKKPDIDKLLRALCDAMTTAGVWMDDSQVVCVEADKRYCVDGIRPSVVVDVRVHQASRA